MFRGMKLSDVIQEVRALNLRLPEGLALTLEQDQLHNRGNEFTHWDNAPQVVT